MSKLGVLDAAVEAASLMTELGLPFALVGGLAVAARAEPRFTRDVDLAVAVGGDRDAEALVHRLARHGWRTAATVEQTRLGRLATVRLRHDRHAVVLDLLFASSGIEHEVVHSAEPLVVRGADRLPVARVGHLIALKLLSVSERRLQDRIDLEALRQVATPEDWALARAAVLLIKARRFNRGRALVTRLRRLRNGN